MELPPQRCRTWNVIRRMPVSDMRRQGHTVVFHGAGIPPRQCERIRRRRTLGRYGGLGLLFKVNDRSQTFDDLRHRSYYLGLTLKITPLVFIMTPVTVLEFKY